MLNCKLEMLGFLKMQAMGKVLQLVLQHSFYFTASLHSLDHWQSERIVYYKGFIYLHPTTIIYSGEATEAL